MSQPIYSATLTRFVLLSLGLHFLLFGLGKSTQHTSLQYLGQTAINVEIQAANHATQPLAKKTTFQPIKKSADHVYIASEGDKYASHPASTSNSDKNAQETSATAESKLRNQLLGQLQTYLSRYLVYPPLARQRGWEGTVLLGLRVEADGRLEKIYIERSSGYAVLDHSALNSLNRLGYLAEASSWLNGHGMNMQLPVIYRLVEN